MDSARVLPCMVCHCPHFVSCINKKQMLMKYIDGNIDIISHISEYQCLCNASSSHKFLTTRLQYKTLKFLRAIYSIITKLKKKHFIQMSSPTHPYVCGPLTCDQRSLYFKFLCKEIIHNLYVLGEHLLAIDTDENAWRHAYDETIQLMHRINSSLWTYCLRYHPRKCRDCRN